MLKVFISSSVSRKTLTLFLANIFIISSSVTQFIPQTEPVPTKPVSQPVYVKITPLQTFAVSSITDQQPVIRDAFIAIKIPPPSQTSKAVNGFNIKIPVSLTGYDAIATINAAYSEVGTSRPTGWSQPGECIMSVNRWVREGNGNWGSGGTPISNYNTATEISLADVQPGDVMQYIYIANPDDWAKGVHTVLITGVNGDGTFRIVQANVPSGSGYVSANDSWTPSPPNGFRAAFFRF